MMISRYIPIWLILANVLHGANGPIGMNTYYFDYWSGQIAFVDAMKQSDAWIASTQGTDEWDSGVEIPLDSLGYPLEIPYTPLGGQPQIAKALMFSGIDSRYPAGTYTLMFEGTGSITIATESGGSLFSQAGAHQVDITPSYWGITLHLNESSAADPVRNIRFILPGHELTYEDEPFYPPFIERLNGFKCLRATHPVNFGTWPCDNGVDVSDASCLMRWETRPSTRYMPQAGPRGLAAEYHIDMANAAGCDLWACVVHAADDDFIRQYAKFIRDRLDPAKKVYVELSNETWNGSLEFPQSIYFRNLGTAQGLDDPEDVRIGRDKAFARRNGRMYQIFEEEFAQQPHRLVKVISSQYPVTEISRMRLEYLTDPVVNTSGVMADALAIGAYFGGHVADEMVARGEEATITIDEILDLVDSSITQDQPNAIHPDWGPNTSFLTRLRMNAALADSFGVQLISYEGGPYVGATGANEEIDTLVVKLIEASRHPRMYDIYNRMLDTWFEYTDGVFMAFAYVNKPARFGTVGHFEWMDQPIAEAHKYRLLMDRLAETTGAALKGPVVRSDRRPAIKIGRVGNMLRIQLAEGEAACEIRLLSLQGRLLKEIIAEPGITEWYMENGEGRDIPTGVLFWRSDNGLGGTVAFID
ncbi:hypothetical protein ACFL5V_03195 [Fibrobacterota bacterium]